MPYLGMLMLGSGILLVGWEYRPRSPGADYTLRNCPTAEVFQPNNCESYLVFSTRQEKGGRSGKESWRDQGSP